MSRRIGILRCSDCGKFISHKDLESGKASVHFTPDTEFTTEETYFTCKECKAVYLLIRCAMRGIEPKFK